MGKLVRGSNHNAFRPKPVENVELSEKKITLRIIVCSIFLLIAVIAITNGLKELFSSDAGWETITADTASEANCSTDFVFQYKLGAGDRSATAENKALKIIYSDACVMAYKLFHHKELYDGVVNVAYINQHPNEVVEVDKALYQAFTLIQNYGSRYLYMAPVYSQYDDIFSCNDDAELIYYNPYLNEEVAQYYLEVAEYANNTEMIDLQLLPDNKVKLKVSDEYLKYAEENGIDVYLDFFWMKNAFIADYLAEELIEKGYTAGVVSSYDGFTRNLCDGEETFTQNIYSRIEDTIYTSAFMNYDSPMSIVCFRDFMLAESDIHRYYEMDDGSIITSYIDHLDGLSKNSLGSMYSYSKGLSCAEIVLQVAPVYITDTFLEEDIQEFVKKDIHFVYSKENILYYTDSSLKWADVYADDSLTFKTQLLNEDNE